MIVSIEVVYDADEYIDVEVQKLIDDMFCIYDK